ncbi:Replication enhancer protein, partial [Bienertia sinuspersici]
VSDDTLQSKSNSFEPIYTIVRGPFNKLGSKPPSIESSNSLSEIVPPPISCHASYFSELVPSVSQSRFTIKRGKSLYFRLGRSHHSRNFLVHRSIARVRIQSAHSERKKRSSWILFLNQNVYHDSMPIHSIKVSTAFSRPSTERCTMLIGMGKDLLLHVLEGSIHGNHH